MLLYLKKNRSAFQNLQVSSDLEREELKNALVATQESAAIQILLEAVLGNGQNKVDGSEQVIGALINYVTRPFVGWFRFEITIR